MDTAPKLRPHKLDTQDAEDEPKTTDSFTACSVFSKMMPLVAKSTVR